MSSPTEFTALRDLVKDSLAKYEAALGASQLPHPELTAPTLHPTDDPNFLPTKELYDSREQLVGALGLLKSAVQVPAERLMAESLAHHTSGALNVAIEAKVADQLLPAGEAGLPATKLGEASGVHPAKLTKVLRFLANMQIFNEVSEGVFSNNRASMLLVSGSPIRDFVSWQTHWSLMGAPYMSSTLLDPKYAQSFNPIDAPNCVGVKAKELGYVDMWGYLANVMPKRVAEFGNAMTAFGSVGIAGMLVDYPWASLPQGTTIVDVGGGQGAMLLPVLKTFPQFKGVLQDRPEVVEVAKKNFEQNLPEAVSEKRISFQSYDFFEDEQPCKGDGYTFMLRWILHDWPDDKCLVILKLLKAAMTPKSKIIIIDTIMQPAVTAPKEGKVDEAMRSTVWPLPLSQGAAGQIKQAVDVEMMQSLNATERTPAMLDALLKQAGLKRVGLYNPRSPHGIVEAMLA